MGAESKIGVTLKDISLADYTLVKLSIEALNLDKKEVKEKVSLGLSILVGTPEKEENKPKRCSAQLQFTIAPVEKEAPYKIEGTIDGLFFVREHDTYSDEEIVEYIRTRGAEELYIIARSLVGSLTAVSSFGTYLLPEIDIEG